MNIDIDIDVHFGKRLYRRRRLLGLTQHDVAQRVGVRFQQIQKYECGANRMSAARLWQMVQALDVPITYFYDGLDTIGRDSRLVSGAQSNEAFAEARP